ncbi:melanoma-associated antigen 4-like [Sorex araneus]|uniref:melanoma-associated antigen 4-like n=1 Tax=Sorex araneus TaxID=42254 RepID=UPI002433695F|nr:melanoma-associated antigen 4-like [Sorex araneus]
MQQQLIYDCSQRVCPPPAAAQTLHPQRPENTISSAYQVPPVNMPVVCAICEAMPYGYKCAVCKVEAQGYQAVSLRSQPNDRAPSQGNEGPDHQMDEDEAWAALREELYDKMANLAGFLLLKFCSKELTTKEEMLSTVLNNDEEHFHLIFNQVCECLQLVFGVDVKQVDPQVQSFTMITTLGLSYDGMVGPEQAMPNSGLLAMVLGIILLEDDCASEDDMWGALSLVGVYPGVEHFIYGEPRELLTKVWVEQQYLEYRQVPGSDPAVYHFLWGPRTLTETNREKVLKFLLRLYNSERKSFFTMPETSPAEGEGGGLGQ